jgi:hypothetical protein
MISIYQKRYKKQYYSAKKKQMSHFLSGDPNPGMEENFIPGFYSTL